MATEKLKVFHSSGATVTAGSTTVNLLSSTSSTQAVVKNVQFTATDANYPVTVNVKSGSHTFASATGVKATGTADNLTGSMIVDVSSTASIEFNTNPTLYTVGYADARWMKPSGSTQMVKLKDNTSTARVDGVASTYASSIGDFSRTLLGPTQDTRGQSAFGYIDASGNKVYGKCFDNVVQIFNDAGTRINPSITYTFTANTYGAATDGVYFYGRRNSNTTDFMKIKISDGVKTTHAISGISNSSGQSSNAGSFMLYHNGFCYSRQSAGETKIQKFNVATGVGSEITVNSFGSYSAGALITTAVDGTPYLIEVGGQSTNECMVINLSDDSVVYPNCSGLSSSTEYGNLALEIQPGVALFFYNTDYIWVDVNASPATAYTGGAALQISDFFPNLSNFNSNSNASSIANIPIAELQGAAYARSTVYTAYADGVLIEGVE